MSTPVTPSSPASNPAAASTATSANSPAAQSTATAASPNPAQKNAPPTPAQQQRLLKIKVDGNEVELPENEVLELASAGKASNRRFQEAAKMKREAEEIYKIAKANPKEFLQKTGMNPREWAEKYLMEELTNEAMSPEQKKAKENEDELRKYRDKDKQDADRKRQEDIDRATNNKREEYDKLFTQALIESGLPRTPFTVKRMAELQLVNIKKKLDLNASQLAKIVREDYVSEQKALLGSLDGDQLIEFLGPELAKKFSKAQISKLKARGNGTGAGSPPVRPRKEEPGLTWRELQKRNRKPL